MGNRDFLILDGTQERRYRNYRCAKCDKGFKIGDECHTHITKKDRIVYHKKCWESMRY